MPLGSLDLTALNRRELQAVAKEHGIKANAKSEQLIDALTKKRQKVEHKAAINIETSAAVPHTENAIDIMHREFPYIDRIKLQTMLEVHEGDADECTAMLQTMLVGVPKQLAMLLGM